METKKKHGNRFNNNIDREYLLVNNYVFYIHTKILEVHLFAFAYRLFHEDFSPIDRLES